MIPMSDEFKRGLLVRAIWAAASFALGMLTFVIFRVLW